MNEFRWRTSPCGFIDWRRASTSRRKHGTPRRSAVAAQRVRDEVRRVIQRTETDPDQGSIYRGTIRWMRLHGLPYLIYYGPISATDIVLYAVAHASRRPGYWLRRTRP